MVPRVEQNSSEPRERGALLAPSADVPTFDQLLTRRDLAERLTAAGYPVKYATLQKMASVGGGPVYQTFGNRTLYRWGPALKWAEGRLSKPRSCSAELDAQRGKAA